MLLKCQYCGKVFEVEGKRRKNFCSSQCQYKNSVAKRKAREESNYEIEKICEDCHKAFLSKYLDEKYCPKCKKKKHTQNVRRESYDFKKILE